MSGDHKEIAEGAVAAGKPAARTRFFEDSPEAAELLARFGERGACLLVKGLRGRKMERSVEALRAAHPQLAEAADRRR